MNIFDRLIEDHGKQRGLAGGIADTTGDSDERKRLFEAYIKELKAHSVAEERTFYGELIEHKEGQDKARHCIAEHKQTEDLLDALIEDTDMATSGWLNRFNKLRHDIEHHLEEEEEDAFVLARSLISDEKAEELGAAFEEIKENEMARRSD